MVEMLLALLVAIVLIGAIGLTVSSGSSSYEQAMDSANVEAKARRMVERIAEELRNASRASIQVNAAGDEIRYQRVLGFNAAGPVVSEVRAIRMRPDPRDPVDDIDNDGDGSVDEQRLEYVTDLAGPNEQVIAWGGSVREVLEGELDNGADDNGDGVIDTPGLHFTLLGIDPGPPEDREQMTITIRLTIEHTGAGQATNTRTVQTMIRARNS